MTKALKLSRGISRTQSNIEGMFCEISQQLENSQRLKIVNYFCKTLHLRCLTRFLLHLGNLLLIVWEN